MASQAPDYHTHPLYVAGVAAHDAAEYDELERIAKQILSENEASGDRAGLAFGYNFLGTARLHRGDGTGADAAYQKALALFRELGWQEEVARLLMNLGSLAVEIHLDSAEARTFYDQCEQIIRKSGNKKWLAVLLGNIGEVCRMEGDYESAVRYGMESLALFREADDSARVSWQLVNIAHYRSLRRDYLGAIEELREAFDELQKSHNARWIAFYFEVWFIIAAELKRWEIAARLLGFADHLRAEKKVARLQIMLPWFSPHVERLSKQLTDERLLELTHEGANLTLKEAQEVTADI